MLTQVKYDFFFYYVNIKYYIIYAYFQALLPLLKTASEKNKSSTGVDKAVIVNMSSILGSIQQNTEGGFYPYRASKVTKFKIIFLLF